MPTQGKRGPKPLPEVPRSADAVTIRPTRGRWESFECRRCGDPTKAIHGTSRHADALCRRCFGKGVDRRPRELNDLSGKEWAQKSRSVAQYPDTRSEKQRIHGASFPRSLAREQIEIYTSRGQCVLDPFVGVGTTMDACREVGRNGIGLDINPDFLELAERDLEPIGSGATVRLLKADARELSEHIGAESIDFVLTSPPYGSLLRQVRGSFAYKWQEHSTIARIPNPRPYSGDPNDLGNLEYQDFLDAIRSVLMETYKVQRQGSYAVWVVKDFRALKADVPYVNYHGHFVQLAEDVGFTLWDLRIWDQTKFRPLVCLGFPSKNFYLNIGHSHLVILRKR